MRLSNAESDVEAQRHVLGCSPRPSEACQSPLAGLPRQSPNVSAQAAAQQHALGCSPLPSEACQSPLAGLPRQRPTVVASAQAAAQAANQAKAAHAAETMTQHGVDAELAELNGPEPAGTKVPYAFPHPDAAKTARQTSINCSAVGGRFSIPHWMQVCKAMDSARRALTPLLPSFQRHRVPASQISVCLNDVAQCIAKESLPEVLRTVPCCKRTKEWLFLNSYTVLFRLTGLVDIPVFLGTLAKRLNPIRTAKAPIAVARVSSCEKWRPIAQLFTFTSFVYLNFFHYHVHAPITPTFRMCAHKASPRSSLVQAAASPSLPPLLSQRLLPPSPDLLLLPSWHRAPTTPPPHLCKQRLKPGTNKPPYRPRRAICRPFLPSLPMPPAIFLQLHESILPTPPINPSAHTPSSKMHSVQFSSTSRQHVFSAGGALAWGIRC